jgi:hypothetical protein
MSYRDEDSGSSNRNVLIVLGVIGGGLLLVLLLCAGLGYLAVIKMTEAVKPMTEMIQDIQKGPQVVDGFLADIRAGQLEPAYRSTTDAFQKRMTLEQFKKLVAEHPALKEPAELLNMDADQGNMKPGAAGFPSAWRYRYKAEGKDGKDRLEFTVTVAKERGDVKVDQLQVFKAVGP